MLFFHNSSYSLILSFHFMTPSSSLLEVLFSPSILRKTNHHLLCIHMWIINYLSGFLPLCPWFFQHTCRLPNFGSNGKFHPNLKDGEESQEYQTTLTPHDWYSPMSRDVGTDIHVNNTRWSPIRTHYNSMTISSFPCMFYLSSCLLTSFIFSPCKTHLWMDLQIQILLKIRYDTLANIAGFW